MVRVVTPGLYKGAPYAKLTESQANTGGRNHYGRITTRHKGGGSKQHYRVIDFKRDKEGIACRIERIEYDPNRTAHIALLLYVDGERRYIIAPKGAKIGDQLMAGRDAPIKVGNSLPLRNIPIGSVVHCIEMKPGKGAQIARSAGASAQLVAREVAEGGGVEFHGPAQESGWSPSQPNEEPGKEGMERKQALTAKLIGKRVRVRLADGRVVVGVLDALDADGNVVLAECEQVGAGPNGQHAVPLGYAIVPSQGVVGLDVALGQ